MIIAAIRASLLQKSQNDWDKGIQHIACAIRNSVHNSTGYSPYFTNFGRNMISSGKEYSKLRAVNSDLNQFEPPKISEEIKQLHKKQQLRKNKP